MTSYALRRHDSPANVGHIYDSATEAHLAILSLYADDLDLHVVPVEDVPGMPGLVYSVEATGPLLMNPDDRDRRTPDRYPPRTL